MPRKTILLAGSVVIAMIVITVAAIYAANKEAGVSEMDQEPYEQGEAAAPPAQPVNYKISTASSMVKVMPNDALPESRSIKLALAGNEYESFQVIVRADIDVEDVKVTLGEFRNGDHQLTDVKWFQVGYVWIETFQGHPTPEIAAAQQPGWYPDPLLPRDSMQLIKDWSNPVWVTVHAPKDAVPGIYKGTVSLEINGESNEVDVEVEVFGFSLPEKPQLPSLFSLSFKYLQEVYGHVSDEMREKWLQYVANYRISPDDMTVHPEQAEWGLNLSAEERDFYKDKVNGFTVYPITSTWGDREAPAEELIERFERMRPYIDQIAATRAIEQGNGVFYGFDENEKEHFETIKRVNAHVKEAYPDIPIMTTSQYIDSYEKMKELNVDILVLHLVDGIYNNAFADQIRAHGKKVWAYISLQPYNPQPNWRIENSPLEARVLLSAMAMHERFDGFLYWSLNYYYKGVGVPAPPIKRDGPILTNWSITTPGEDLQWLHGDGVLLYAGADGPIGSIRMENIRDGLEDYEYYKQLEKLSGFEAASKAAAEIVTSTSEFIRNPAELYDARRRVAEAISGR
ncbi:glycoside hydrolase domain-containing protein [Paenibacillus sp. GCM10027626]|uniref:DUF4091 domain-containing protein n=1 Tax=Paenibacillus sp. GCM10027626 TaxID=3273411 RepID=UPI00363DBB02